MAASTVSGDLKVTGLVGVGAASPQAEITAGSGAIDTSNKATTSMHLRSDGHVEVKRSSGSEKLGFAQHASESRMGTLTANSANTYTFFAHRNLTVIGISRYFLVHPTSSSGTVVTSITGGGNELLQSSSESEEGLSDATLTAYTLTGTTADLTLSKGDKIVITITSNNADMINGTDTQVYIYAEDN